jgi:hypothetical protein
MPLVRDQAAAESVYINNLVGDNTNKGEKQLN